MRDSHAHLDINESQWQAFLDLLKQSLDKFQVPLPEQGEVFALVESTRAEIVVA